MESEKRGMDLEKELTCSICTEVLYQPLTLLDCLHTFCGACLKQWFEWQLTAARSSPNSLPPGTTPYTCPSCRAPVRDTKHNATVTTLVDMVVAASPEKGKTDEEKEDLKNKYTPGENVLPKVEEREKSLRERRVEDADRRLMNEVRDLSLREVGVESPEARRERRRREESRSQATRAPRSRDTSRDSRNTEEREQERRRRREAESDRRHAGSSNGTLQPGPESTEDRRRRRSGERRTRHELENRTAARQIEHQSSLRSLISASDVDSREMEEEILRQIREEGLLDGIDLENIDVSEQDQISERIAEAFRRRQSERARQEPARRSNASATSAVSAVSGVSTTGGQRRRTHSAAPDSRENSGDDSARPSSRRQRPHSRSPSAVSQDQPSRPPQSMSAIQAAHLDVQSGDEGRHRRRRTTSDSRSSTTPIPVAESQVRLAARSQTDLSNRPQSANISSTRPSVSATARSTTEPTVTQAAELPATQSRSRASSNSSPRLRSAARMEDVSMAATRTERTTRAPPENIFVPAAGASVISSPVTEQSLMPAPLSPRAHQAPQTSSLSDRAFALSSGSRPSSSGSVASRHRSHLYPEPSITCNRCSKPHIEYDLHYNCSMCHSGNWNICLPCYRSGAGCLHWFGFGQAAWAKWEKLSQGGNIERPHMLTGSRYIPPRIAPGGADGRRTLTTDDPQKRLQSGTFCASCLAWTNECYWRCDFCNEGDWGFCNLCVNQGKSCTHALLPLTYKPTETNTPPLSPTHDQKTPPSASILTGPGVMDIGPFKPLTFSTKCDICHYPIQPSQSRYHCFSCTSKVPNTLPGDYDICTTCYPKLVASRRISAENGQNGQNGWRRCLQGHRMVVVGFEDNRGGQRRVTVHDLVGGRGLSEQAYSHTDHSGAELQKWTWGDGVHMRGDDSHVRLVTTDVMKTAPLNSPELVLDTTFPPDGGVGMVTIALWSWWPAPDADDELMFPKGAEIKECKNVNDDWWHGTYMGKRGLFPAPYVKVMDKIM